MKKYLLLVVLCMASLGVMAQHTTQPQPGYPQGHPTTQYDQHHHGGHHDHYNDQHHSHQPAPAPVICASPEQMQMAIQVLEKQYSDDKRMDVAKLCVMLGHFCTADIARLGSRFTMEDSKVSFFRFAYPYCQDPQNYYTLRDALRYKSDYDKLMESCRPGTATPYRR